jgi:hypothetical protein
MIELQGVYLKIKTRIFFLNHFLEGKIRRKMIFFPIFFLVLPFFFLPLPFIL